MMAHAVNMHIECTRWAQCGVPTSPAAPAGVLENVAHRTRWAAAAVCAFSAFPWRARLVQQGSLVLAIAALLVALTSCVEPPRLGANVSSQDWRTEFDLTNRQLTPTGESKYFVLKPGFQVVLASRNERLTINVLGETREINGITTRVIEERHETNGQIVEISRNLFALDEQTGDVFYFGEEVDMYAGGEITGHAGAWIAYANGNKPGLIMPGTPEVGLKYYQELAPSVAMDRAEVVRVSETRRTPAGELTNCVTMRESSSLEPTVIELKTYAPGIGLIQDEGLVLLSYGYVGQ